MVTQPLDAGLGYELNRANGTRLDVTKTLQRQNSENLSKTVRRWCWTTCIRRRELCAAVRIVVPGLARVGKKYFQPVTLESAAHTAIAIVAMIGLTILGLAVRTGCQQVAGSRHRHGGRWSAGRQRSVRRVALVARAHRSAQRVRMGRGAVTGDGMRYRAAGQRRGGACLHRSDWLRGSHVRAGHADRASLHDRSGLHALCASGSIVAGARMWRPVHGQWLGMGTLDHIAAAAEREATFALSTARIRPPHFGSITGRDMFRRSDGAPVETVSPVEEGVDEDQPNPDTAPQGW